MFRNIIFILVLALIPVQSLATLTGTVDSKARVSLSTNTTGSSFVWKKDGITFATTGTGSTIDNRPNKHYTYVPAQSCTESGGTFADFNNSHHRSTGGNARQIININGTVTFTFTGVEFVVMLDALQNTSGIGSDTLAEARVDGGSWEDITIESTSYNLYSTFAWGKSGLSNASHTVNVRLKTDTYGIGMAFDGYYYTDRSVSLGVPVGYSVTIDGGTPETATITPNVNRLTVIQNWIDQIVTKYATYNYGDYAGFIEITDHMGALASAYIITGDSRLPALADKVYGWYIANSSGTTGVMTDNNSLTWNGRIGYNYYMAYKAFGDSRYLAVADKIATYLRTSWPRDSITLNSTTYTNIWLSATTAGNIEADGNRWSAPAYSCALVYNDPASSNYHNATLLQRIQDNAGWSVTSVLSDGTIIIGPEHSNLVSRVYGTYQFENIRYLSDTLGLYTTEAGKMATWLSSFGTNEGAWQDVYSLASDGSTSTPNSEMIIWGITALNMSGTSIPTDYVDRAYSAAFAGPYLKYDPLGASDATQTLDSLLRFTPFWAGRSAYIAGIPLQTWAVNLAAKNLQTRGGKLQARGGKLILR